jgi:hypothetical protein
MRVNRLPTLQTAVFEVVGKENLFLSVALARNAAKAKEQHEAG